MNIYSVIPLLSSILFLAFGLFVFLKNKKSVVNITFALICLVTFWWQFSLCFLFNAKSEVLAGYLVKVAYMGIIFIPIFFFHFYISFLGKVKKFDRFLLYFAYLSGLLFEVILIRTDYFIDGFHEYFWGFYPKSGILHPIYLVLLAFLACRIFYLLFSSMRKNSLVSLSSREYDQTKYALWAVIFYTFASLDFLINYGIEFYPFGYLFILMSLGIFSYSIVKYRLMDISWVLGRTGVYILSFSSVIFYAFSLSLISQKLGYIAFPIILNVFIAITSILLFLYLFRIFEKLAAKYFYYTFYTLQQTIKGLNGQLNKTIKLDSLVELVIRSLLDALKLDRAGIILQEPKEKDFYVQSVIKFKEQDLSFLTRSENKFLIMRIQQLKKPIVREEISFIIKDIQAEKGSDKELAKEEIKGLNDVREAMEKTKIGLLLPLFIEDQLIGILVLGDKLSKEAYTVQDLNLLSVLSAQAAVAFNNALSYDEINQRKADLEKFYKLTVGRELKMAELKKKIRDMERQEE